MCHSVYLPLVVVFAVPAVVVSRCGIGSSDGGCLSMASYVTVTGAHGRGARAAGGW